MSAPQPEPPRFEHPPPAERMFTFGQFAPQALAEAKQTQGLTLTVALPALDEAATIGPILDTIRGQLMERHQLVDELMVIDDGSSDATAQIAANSGARVVPASDVLPHYGSGGKGEALWKSLAVSSGDLIVWCDADITNFDERFILGVAGPLLTNPDVGFVKGYYRRPLNAEGEGGGRVTELMARPLIATLFPVLGDLVQPLSGEFGGRRELLEAVPFHRGYAVDLGLLVDLAASFGVDTIAQVDLGARLHRNRPLRQLGPQAAAILAMALERTGAVEAAADEHKPGKLVMARPEFGDAEINTGQLPPLATLRNEPGLTFTAQA